MKTKAGKSSIISEHNSFISAIFKIADDITIFTMSEFFICKTVFESALPVKIFSKTLKKQQIKKKSIKLLWKINFLYFDPSV